MTKDSGQMAVRGLNEHYPLFFAISCHRSKTVSIRSYNRLANT